MEVHEDFLKSQVQKAASYFRLLGEPNRIQLLFLLLTEEYCVGELAAQMGITQSAVSHQLHLLKVSRLITCQRKGKVVLYRISDEMTRNLLLRVKENLTQKQT